MADALSTAFSVMTTEQTTAYCHQHPEVGVILVPPPEKGSTLKPIVLNLDDKQLIWETAQTKK